MTNQLDALKVATSAASINAYIITHEIVYVLDGLTKKEVGDLGSALFKLNEGLAGVMDFLDSRGESYNAG